MASIFKKTLTIFLMLFVLVAPTAAYERIVSLYPGHTDNIVALGGQSRLVGLSKSNDPSRLPELPRFALNVGAEALLALKPDLVLTRTLVEKQNPELRGVLERAGVPVMLVDPPSWDGFVAYLRALAPLIGVAPQAAEAQFAQACDEIRQTAAARRGGRPAPSVFVEATAKELHTCAPDSWAAHLLELAGGRNAAADAEPLRRGSAVAPWGVERVMKLLAGGLDVYLIQHGPMNRASLDEVKARPWAKTLVPVKIAQIPEYWLSRPSLLGLKAGGAELMRIFYGE
ncbi:ABC transporter substrate-binding protein [Pyramidobacter piscolens]|uniref:ABC transporter substrate-binding protein n=1 Tax=Pyramidobacter piscolens TaxID=638849 RepID=UPI0026DF69D9|nr:ABC transporter substrate-binding protein [Pyramidobacter piscolens]